MPRVWSGEATVNTSLLHTPAFWYLASLCVIHRHLHLMTVSSYRSLRLFLLFLHPPF